MEPSNLPLSPYTVPEAKKQLRSDMIALRRQCLAADLNLPSRITTTILTNLKPGKDKVCALYLALPDEVALDAVAQRWTAAGVTLALPAVMAKNQPLQFRRYRWGDALQTGVWGIQEPLPQQPVVEPDLLLVPLLAFDRVGNRLGYGGGYYDRTLERLRSLKPIQAVGIGLAALQQPALPVALHDQKLDSVITEQGYLKFS